MVQQNAAKVRWLNNSICFRLFFDATQGFLDPCQKHVAEPKLLLLIPESGLGNILLCDSPENDLH